MSDACEVYGVQKLTRGTDGSGTTDPELDQRDMLGRHGETSSSGGNGKRPGLCRAGCRKYLTREARRAQEGWS
jgi:hypothetical protein